MTPQQIMDMTADRRDFHELFDVLIVDDIYKPTNFCVEVFDKFGRKARTIFGNVFPKIGETFDTYSPNIIAHCLMNHMYEMSLVQRQHTMQTIVYPWAGFRIRNIVRFVRGELSLVSVANGVVADADAGRVYSVGVPVAAKPVLLGNALLELRTQTKEGYPLQKIAQFFEEWKSFISDFPSAPKTEIMLMWTLEHLAALHDVEFEYGPEGVGLTFTLGRKVTVKYHKPKKSALVETALGQTFTFEVASQGQDLVQAVLDAITATPQGMSAGISNSAGRAAVDSLKERLTYCPDDRLACFVRSDYEFDIIRRDKEHHKSVLLTAIDSHNQAYLVFVLEKNGALVRRELRTANPKDVEDFYNVIAGYMEIQQ